MQSVYWATFSQTAAEALYTDINNLELHVSPWFCYYLGPIWMMFHIRSGYRRKKPRSPCQVQAYAQDTPSPGPFLLMLRPWLGETDFYQPTSLVRQTSSHVILSFTSCCVLAFDLTSWGFQDCQYDRSDGSLGGILGKMLYRTLPDYYPADSAYAKFPFLVPPFLKDHLPKRLVDEYIWSRPPLPKRSITVSTYRDAGRILADEKTFQAGYDRNIASINGIALHKSTVRRVYALNHALSASHFFQVQQLLFSGPHIQTWVQYFRDITGTLIKEKSITHASSTLTYVDIVKDVINLLPIYWIADKLVRLHLSRVFSLTINIHYFPLFLLFSSTLRPRPKAILAAFTDTKSYTNNLPMSASESESISCLYHYFILVQLCSYEPRCRQRLDPTRPRP